MRCWSLLFGVFFNLLKMSMTGESWLVFPIACFDDAEVLQLKNKDQVQVTVVQNKPAWMNVLNSDMYRERCGGISCQNRASVMCHKTFDMSRLVKRNLKLYVKVTVEQEIHYSCPLTFLLYSGNSVRPIETIHCWIPFSRMLHWPDTNLTLAVMFNRYKADITNLSDTKLYLQAGTCRNCFRMELPPQSPVIAKTWHVTLPVQCATRACLEYKPFFYTIQALSGIYVHGLSQTPCYVTFDIKDNSVRVKTCLQLSPKKYDVHPCNHELSLVLKIDGVTYMEIKTGGLNDFWCLPNEWMRKKSTLALQWKGGNYVCDEEPWTLHVRSNITQYKYYSSCQQNPYQEMNFTQQVYFKPSFGSNTSQGYGSPESVDHYTAPVQWTILPASLCTAIVAVISIIVVICVIRRRRSRQTARTARPVRQNIRQLSQQRHPPNTTDINTSHGLTQLEELTPAIPTAPPCNDTDQESADLDLPPPYPGLEMAPPSYEEVCRFIPPPPQPDMITNK